MFRVFAVGICILSKLVFSTAKSCPGFCTNDLESCTGNNGKVVGYCANEMACCDMVAGVTGTCGSTFKRLNMSYFKSPGFPQNSSGDLNCEFNLKLNENSSGIRLDFLQFESDSMGYGQDKSCDSDMFFIRGFQTWMPQPRCGQLTNYSTIIVRKGTQTKDLKTLNLLALMSSPAYLWHIRITQIFGTKISGGSEQSLKSEDDVADPVEEKKSSELQMGQKHPEFKTNFLQVLMNSFSTGESSETKNHKDLGENFDSERNLEPALNSIINGVETNINRVPWQASIRMLYTTEQYTSEAIQEATGENCSISEGIHFCGGSIVGEQHILTAAHCFFGSSKTQGMTDLTVAKIILGDTNRCKDDNSSTYNSSVYDIDNVIFHYAYDSGTVDNDLAVVKLKQKIEFKEHVKAIQLARADSSYAAGERALVSGWGMTETGEDTTRGLPEVLISNDHFTIENETYCRTVLEEALGDIADNVRQHVKYNHYFDGVFCTGSKPKDRLEGFTGQGDSGGSLVIRSNETEDYVQLGIVSFALPYNLSGTDGNFTASHPASGIQNNCRADEEVDYFQSVAYHRLWIDMALQG